MRRVMKATTIPSSWSSEGKLISPPTYSPKLLRGITARPLPPSDRSGVVNIAVVGQHHVLEKGFGGAQGIVNQGLRFGIHSLGL